MYRDLSVTEASTLLDCSWRWDLAYGGHLAGDALRPRDTPLLLREGRAWGRAMAALHRDWNATDRLVTAARAAQDSLADDEAERVAAGLGDQAAFTATLGKLLGVLAHYDRLAEPLPLYGAETRLLIALPARERHSNRYRLECHLDGLHDDEHGTWVVEFKWRAARIVDFELAARARQLRWYAWAWRERLGREPVGVILDERLGQDLPPVRHNQDGRLSRVQSCTAEHYQAAGGDDPELLATLRGKQWQARRRLTFRPGELDQAGWELRTLARLTQQHDSARLAPVRNPSQYHCGRCRYRAICDDPGDAEQVVALYERRPPKRDREAVTDAA